MLTSLLGLKYAVHVWRHDSMILSQIYAAEQKLEGKEYVKHTLSHTHRGGERGEPWSSRA